MFDFFKRKKKKENVKIDDELEAKDIPCEPIRFDEYTHKKMTFFHDPDGLPIEIHE